MIKRFFRYLKKNENGVSFVEFAIVLPILLALVIGIIEFGWLFNGYIIMNGAAREGARLAARGEEFDAINTRVRNHAEFILKVEIDEVEAVVNPPIIEPLNYPEGVPLGGEITVRVEGTLPLLFKFLGGDSIPFPLLDDPFPLRAEATMRREY